MTANDARETRRHVSGAVDTSAGAVPWLIGYLVVLFLPQRLMLLPSAGFLGTPSILAGLALGLLWLLLRLRHGTWRYPDAVTTGLALFIIALMFSYGLAPGVTTAGEVRGTDRTLISWLCYVAVTLFVMHGLRRRVLIERVGFFLVLIATAVGVGGIAESMIPTFSVHDAVRSLGILSGAPSTPDMRGGLRRAVSTSGHPIELATVCAVLVPVALHYVRADRRSVRVLAWISVIVLPVASLLTVSRTGVVAMAVGLVTYAVMAGRRILLRVILVAAPVVTILLVADVGGVATAFEGLFNSPNDPSIQGRVRDYGQVADFVAAHVVFGRGVGTFIPERYVVLDNQYLGLLVEGGVAAVVAFGFLLGATLATAKRVRRLSAGSSAADIVAALSAVVISLGVTACFFDLLAFRQASSILFFAIGAIAALDRDTPPPQRGAAPSPGPSEGEESPATDRAVLGTSS